ncbi:MAG: hypothetical protein Q8P51_08020 [Ignavibacteria bacterium]|nr:hypothetical protein [Ignavibacteria bacterium]
MSLNIVLMMLFSGLNISTTMQETSPAYYIAYNVLVDSKTDNYDVFAINLDGSNKRNITNHKDLAWTYYAWKERHAGTLHCAPAVHHRHALWYGRLNEQQTRSC